LRYTRRVKSRRRAWLKPKRSNGRRFGRPPASRSWPSCCSARGSSRGSSYWGGASRRLFYDFHEIAGVDFAVKLDFESAGFVANKLTHALPGTLWIQGPLEWTLQHPSLIIASVWMWTFTEIAVGLGLIFGLATRLAALSASASISC
jgi:TQO small subunit DoxD